MAGHPAVQAELSDLRRQIARIEGRLADEDRLEKTLVSQHLAPHRSWGAKERRGRLPLGVPGLDKLLGGGIPLGTLHEIRAEETRDAAAGAGFLLAILAHHADAAGCMPIVWISEARSRLEAGDIYAPGLAEMGLDPDLVISVAVRTPEEALWAFEAALSCRKVGAAICEMRRVPLALSATRRCALKARDAGVTGFLLRLGMKPEPTAAEIRLSLSPAPAGTIDDFAAGIGRVAWTIGVEKSRGGRTGTFTVEWNAYERAFAERPAEAGRDAAAHPEPVAATLAAGPAPSPGGAAGTALPRPVWRRAS